MDWRSQPGELAREYSRRKGWTLLRANLMVEGNLDVRYFNLASKLHGEKSGLHLCGVDLSVFAAGTGDAGGTFGIQEQFPVLRHVIKQDLDKDGRLVFRLAALMDNDHNGRLAIRSICKIDRSILENRELFLLHRHLPRKSREPVPLTRHIAEANSNFAGLDCQIEDLLGAELIKAFLHEEPNAAVPVGGVSGTYRWSEDGKHRLVRFVESYAVLADIESIVEVLRSLRFYVGLVPDGVAKR